MTEHLKLDVRKEAAEFLRTRRERITPERAGLTAWGERRRVKGLRREEVALLAGVSVEYYVRLERGGVAGASESVLEAVANALQLDDAERAHLYDLARTSGRGASGRSGRSTVRPPVQWLLDSMSGTAAYVRNARTDLLAASAHGRALYARFSPCLDGRTSPGSSFSTPAPRTSSSSGARWPEKLQRCCGRWPVRTRTTSA